MSIDEAIYCMKSYMPNEEYTHCTECKYYGARNNNTCASSEAHQVAVETMRKYQKIEELYDYWRSGKCEYTISCMENIGKVLKDGKID